MMIIFAGLPGVGKTTIARRLSSELGAVYLRIDTIEQALRDSGMADEEIGGIGYLIAQRLAYENLLAGNQVVVDSVNPWELTRKAYRDVAENAGCPHLDVEVLCSDPDIHRHRVETRVSDLAGHTLPTWAQVTGRDYHEWLEQPLQIDTAVLSQEQAVELIRRKLRELG